MARWLVHLAHQKIDTDKCGTYNKDMSSKSGGITMQVITGSLGFAGQKSD